MTLLFVGSTKFTMAMKSAHNNRTVSTNQQIKPKQNVSFSDSNNQLSYDRNSPTNTPINSETVPQSTKPSNLGYTKKLSSNNKQEINLMNEENLDYNEQQDKITSSRANLSNKEKLNLLQEEFTIIDNEINNIRDVRGYQQLKRDLQQRTDEINSLKSSQDQPTQAELQPIRAAVKKVEIQPALDLNIKLKDLNNELLSLNDELNFLLDPIQTPNPRRIADVKNKISRLQNEQLTPAESQPIRAAVKKVEIQPAHDESQSPTSITEITFNQSEKLTPSNLQTSAIQETQEEAQRRRIAKVTNETPRLQNKNSKNHAEWMKIVKIKEDVNNIINDTSISNYQKINKINLIKNNSPEFQSAEYQNILNTDLDSSIQKLEKSLDLAKQKFGLRIDNTLENRIKLLQFDVEDLQIQRNEAFEIYNDEQTFTNLKPIMSIAFTILVKKGSITAKSIGLTIANLFRDAGVKPSTKDLEGMTKAADKNKPAPNATDAQKATWIGNITRMISNVFSRSKKNEKQKEETFDPKDDYPTITDYTATSPETYYTV